jgi:ParB-like chromosome segregation protein Spo0J
MHLLKSARRSAGPEFREIIEYDDSQKIEILNEIKKELSLYSPFQNEPVDCILWIDSKKIQANDYNPNQVAPPEMKLLEHSIREDGYTQPIVVWPQNGIYEVIDGFHRNRVGKEIEDIKSRVKNYLPVTIINPDREKRNDRVAATIRHNRARGKHSIDGMAEIIIDLKKRNWSNKKIGKELGMDPDEILRLSQITGLAEMFEDKEFSEAWEADIENTINENDNLKIEHED